MTSVKVRAPPIARIPTVILQVAGMRRRSILLLAGPIAAAVIGAGIYKWVDEKGVTHYSDAPPAEKALRREILPGAPEGATELPARGWQRRDEEFRQRHQARQKELDEEFVERQRAAEIAEIERGGRTPVPGGTGAPPALQRDVLRLLVVIDGSADRSCTSHRVITTEWLEADRETRTAVERWTLDRCGKTVRYRVVFTAAPQGGTTFSIRAEG
jgi:hypothetical protein